MNVLSRTAPPRRCEAIASTSPVVGSSDDVSAIGVRALHGVVQGALRDLPQLGVGVNTTSAPGTGSLMTRAGARVLASVAILENHGGAGAGP